MRKINWEKVGVYLACVGVLFMFWHSQERSSETISYLRERIAVLEIKILFLDKKSNSSDIHTPQSQK